MYPTPPPSTETSLGVPDLRGCVTTTFVILSEVYRPEVRLSIDSTALSTSVSGTHLKGDRVRLLIGIHQFSRNL